MSEKTTVEEVKAPVIDANLVESAKTELEDHKKSLKGKVYPVKVKDADSIDGFIFFIENKAEWKSMEAIGIIEVSKILNQVKNEPLKDSCFFLPNLALEALSFFLNRVTGEGKDKAVSFLELFKPINQAMGMVKADTDKMHELERKLAAAEHGIKIEEKIEGTDE